MYFFFFVSFWGYSVCQCPIKSTPGLYGLNCVIGRIIGASGATRRSNDAKKVVQYIICFEIRIVYDFVILSTLWQKLVLICETIKGL